MSAGCTQSGIPQQVTELCGRTCSPPRCLYFGVADLRKLLESAGRVFREVVIDHVELNAYGKSMGCPHLPWDGGGCKHSAGQRKETASRNLHIAPYAHRITSMGDCIETCKMRERFRRQGSGGFRRRRGT